MEPNTSRPFSKRGSGTIKNSVECSYKKSKVKGNVLISHVGLTGPGIIDLSSIISKEIDYDILDNDDDLACEINIDLTPDFSREELKNKFDEDFQIKGKTQIKNYLKNFLTSLKFLPLSGKWSPSSATK